MRLAPVTVIKVHTFRAKGSPLKSFGIAIELLDPASRIPVVFKVNGRHSSFYIQKVFVKHNVLSESWELPINSNEYLNVWKCAMYSMGSDLTLRESVLDVFSKLEKRKTNELLLRVARAAGSEPEALIAHLRANRPTI